jgi:hypothetical protein
LNEQGGPPAEPRCDEDKADGGADGSHSRLFLHLWTRDHEAKRGQNAIPDVKPYCPKRDHGQKSQAQLVGQWSSETNHRMRRRGHRPGKVERSDYLGEE